MRDWRKWARRWQTWVGGAALLFGLSIVYFLVTGLMMPDLVPVNTQAKIVIKGIAGQGMREGRTSWRFSAQKSEFSVDGATQLYHRAYATYYLQGKPTYKIVAGDVTVDARSLNYTASNGVHVWSIGLPENQHFITQALMWNNGLQTLTCPGLTDVLYHGVAIKTDHLTANLVTGMVTLGQSTAKVGTTLPTPPSANRSL